MAYNKSYKKEFVPYNGGGRDFVPKKPSGCTVKPVMVWEDKSQQTELFGAGAPVPVFSGWMRKSKVFSTFYARPWKKSQRVQSKTGKHWINYLVTVTTGTQQSLYGGMLEVATGTVFIKDLGLMMRPKSDYIGQFFRSKK